MSDSKDKVCRNCIFFEAHVDDCSGTCRRFPPIAVRFAKTEHGNAVFHWPTTCFEEWCGEFEAES